MLVVKDAMILIHLAKLTLLRTACEYFGDVRVPRGVEAETVDAGRAHGYPDATVIVESVEDGALEVMDIADVDLVERANQFNVQGGEAEAVALAWELDADHLATDDDNVRRKESLLGLRLIGTPAILLALFQDGLIDAAMLDRAVETLRDVGWFSAAVLDKVLLEARDR